MEQKREARTPRTLAAVSRALLIAALCCCAGALVLVPFLVDQRLLVDLGLFTGGWQGEGVWELIFARPWRRVWENPYTAVLTVFLWVCGALAAVILCQALRVLGTVRRGEPFQGANADSMRLAAVCFFLISAAALIRTVWGLFYYRSILALLTYTALFVPVFALGGLLCMVMSALFRQAAALKEENDLTI